MQPTASLLARISRKLRLTTKQSSVRGGYYKGTGSGAMGRHTKHGGYIIDPAKVRTYVVPSGLNESKLTPFVSRKIKQKDIPSERLDGKSYLQQWKEQNGVS